jgi:glycosyltransferase involved in cell wall biosynthesis
MNKAPSLTVAIPVYNEQDVIEELIDRVSQVLDTIPGGPHQIVIVDDGSYDDTTQLLSQAVTADPRIVAVSFSRNFGQQPAYAAALEYAEGDAVVLMDGDLQDPPEQIPTLLARYNEGFDVVYAVRVNRKENILKRTCYNLFYRLIKRISKTTLPRDSGDFSIISRRVADLLVRDADRHRYLRGIRSWVGFKQTGIAIERAPRAAGDTKYSLLKLFRLAADGIFSFSLIPLRLATFIGALSVFIALGLTVFATWARFTAPEQPEFISEIPAGFTAQLVAISFFAGVQLMFLGVVGEYIGRIFEEVKGRPPFIVENVIGNSAKCKANMQKTTDSFTTITGGGDRENPTS